ncbi:MAG: PEP-CTERM sorting domain-containing protein [Verrucomicrobiae bacterium]
MRCFCLLLVDGGQLSEINTFPEGYGGRLGDTGGGVLVAPYRDWIVQTTGIPEPVTWLLVLAGMAFIIAVRRGRCLQRAKR